MDAYGEEEGNQCTSVEGHPASSNKHTTNLSWDNRLMIALNKAIVPRATYTDALS